MGGYSLVPVEHDPFQGNGYSLVPVDHDPFQGQDVDWSHLNQPFGTVSSGPDPTPSQRVSDAASDALMAAGAQPYVANHLVSGIGHVLGLTPLAVPMAAADLIDAGNKRDIAGAAQAAIGMVPGVNREEHLLTGEFDIPAIADHLSRMAEDMGFRVGRESSNLSKSEYLHLEHPNLENGLKIRIADHSLPPSYPNSANIEVGPHGEATGWANAIDWLARKIGVQTPEPAASQLAADEAENVRMRQLQAERTAAYVDSQRARAAALEGVKNSPNADRIAELQAKLADRSITGNQRKKLNEKLRNALGYTKTP